MKGHYDFQLNPGQFGKLEKEFGPHTFDRLASTETAKCPKFCSAWFGPACQWVNAFSTLWNPTENNYASPPPRLAPRTIAHIKASRACATFVLMNWEGALVWPMFSPNGTQNRAHPWVKAQIPLGTAEQALSYPSSFSKQHCQHLPKGEVVALRLDCRN